MGDIKMYTDNLPNLPWQEKLQNNSAPVWRYTENPIIGRNPMAGASRIYNGAVVPYQGRFIGVFCAARYNGQPQLYLGHSDNGISWTYEPEKIYFINENGEPFVPSFSYDPCLIKAEDAYYIVWSTDFYGEGLGLAKTKDFNTFIRMENPFLPFHKNGVLFTRKINGNYMLLSTPGNGSLTSLSDIFISESPDLLYWGKHKRVMSKSSKQWWDSISIGCGAAPIETSEGWLLFYYGLAGTCNGYVYSIGAALLDTENPSIIKYRLENFILTPEEWYEERGFTANVVTPCSTLHDAATGRIAIYYGAAETYLGLAFTTLDEIVAYIKENAIKEQDNII